MSPIKVATCGMYGSTWAEAGSPTSRSSPIGVISCTGNIVSRSLTFKVALVKPIPSASLAFKLASGITFPRVRPL